MSRFGSVACHLLGSAACLLGSWLGATLSTYCEPRAKADGLSPFAESGYVVGIAFGASVFIAGILVALVLICRAAYVQLNWEGVA